MTGLEWLILALVAYATAAPDRATLAATRGAAGAFRAGVSGSSTRPSRGGRRNSSGSSSRVHTVTSAPSPSRWAAARAGWRDGVQSGRDRRHEGRDLVGRTRRVVGAAAYRLSGSRHRRIGNAAAWLSWHLNGRRHAEGVVDEPVPGDVIDEPTPAPGTPADAEHVDVDQELVDPMPDQVAARVQEALNTLRDLTPDGQLCWVAGWTPTDPRHTAEGSTTPTGADEHTTTNTTPTRGDITTMQTTELESLDAVDAEAQAAIAMCEELTETITQAQQWAAGLADRWSGTDWGTADLNAGVEAVSEAAGQLGTAESLAEALAVVRAAVEKARALGEVVAEHGAHGRTDAFTPA